MSIDWADFDAKLDEYQASLYEEVAENADRSHETAARPDAVPCEVTFGDLRVGDYMTNEGPGGRWVKVIEIRVYPRVSEGTVSVMFEIPEPVAVSGETRYWLDRPVSERVFIDQRVRVEAA